jgi:hypothetical protein
MEQARDVHFVFYFPADEKNNLVAVTHHLHFFNPQYRNLPPLMNEHSQHRLHFAKEEMQALVSYRFVPVLFQLIMRCIKSHSQPLPSLP